MCALASILPLGPGSPPRARPRHTLRLTLQRTGFCGSGGLTLPRAPFLPSPDSGSWERRCVETPLAWPCQKVAR